MQILKIGILSVCYGSMGIGGSCRAEQGKLWHLENGLLLSRIFKMDIVWYYMNMVPADLATIMKNQKSLTVFAEPE